MSEQRSRDVCCMRKSGDPVLLYSIEPHHTRISQDRHVFPQSDSEEGRDGMRPGYDLDAQLAGSPHGFRSFVKNRVSPLNCIRRSHEATSSMRGRRVFADASWCARPGWDRRWPWWRMHRQEWLNRWRLWKSHVQLTSHIPKIR